MTVKSPIERHAIREAIASAVRKRAPQSDLDRWYWDVQEGSGVGRDTIRALCRDEDGPATDILNFYRLLSYFGPEFGADCLTPLTGLHVGLDPSVAECELSDLKTRIGALDTHAKGVFERLVDEKEKHAAEPIPFKGPIK